MLIEDWNVGDSKFIFILFCILIFRCHQFESIVAELELLHKNIRVEARVATQTSVSGMAFALHFDYSLADTRFSQPTS